MAKFHHMTYADRLRLETLLQAGHSKAEAARLLGYSRAAITKETRRGAGLTGVTRRLRLTARILPSATMSAPVRPRARPLSWVRITPFPLTLNGALFATVTARRLRWTRLPLMGFTSA